MSVSEYTLFAIVGLLLTSLCLELTPQPHAELITECCCWGVILLSGKLYFTYVPSSARPYKAAELSNIAFGVVLICLSSSFKQTLWSLAPLLCPVVVFYGRSRRYLPVHVETKTEEAGGQLGGQPGGQGVTKRISASVILYAVVTTTLLVLTDPERYDFRFKVCWLLAQAILYWALSRRVDDIKDVEASNVEEAMRTATELAPYVVLATVPLATLLWSGFPAIQVAGPVALLKACRWISVLVLVHESKLSILPWATTFTICTKATWAIPLLPQSVLAVFGALIALYRTAMTFSPSDRRRWIVLVLALCPLAAFVHNHRLSPQALPWQKTPEVVTGRLSGTHPIARLAEEAQARFDQIQSQQSQSLSSAVSEYRKRYGRPPPPGFDRWYKWAVENEIQWIDEYDMLTKSFDLFYQLPPKVLREYVEQALSARGVNMLEVKDHNARLRSGSFHHGQLLELLKPVTHLLPDIRAPLNEHDEPRVLPPHDTIHGKAADHSGASLTESQPVFFAAQGRQNIWNWVTLSCPPDSRARAALIEPLSEPAFPPFVSNLKARQDLCSWSGSESLRHGYLSSPSTFDYTQSLVPMMSTSTLSTFRDLLIPSSYYFQDDIYDRKEDEDSAWDDKKPVVYWRGTGTGGHWHDGSWRTGHRQRFVNFTTHPEADVRLMKEQAPGHWATYQSHMGEVIGNFEVNFTNFIQCDTKDCLDEEIYFGKAQRDAEHNSHQYKVLYNLDGNSFSGRYYRYLKSNSLVFMQALFQEWHDDRILPWVHFVPISVGMEELPETARYLLNDPAGQVLAERIANTSRAWARRTLRPVDLTSAYFRAFIEYARLMDDDRDNLSCC